MAGKLEQKSTELIFPGNGEMTHRMREFDWSKTVVGPTETWPQSLKTTLGICLSSKFPMCLWWGKDLIVFYNDGYIPFASKKHPQFIGRPAREQWAEIWDTLEPITKHVFETGEANWAESMQLFITRNDFLEESYFTFSYTPIWDESGKVAGIINPCQEKTGKVISERRLKLLNHLGTMNVNSTSALAQQSIQVLNSNLNDIPMAQFYLIEKNGPPQLKAEFGWSEGNTLDPIWPFDEIIQTKAPRLVTNLRNRFPASIPIVPYTEGPDSAYVIPLVPNSSEMLTAILILGVSARLEFNKSYEDFFGLIGNQITSHLTNFLALEKEKLMVESLAAIDQAKTTFFNNISHEFRTPITLMLSPIEDALKETLPNSIKTNLEVVHRNGVRLLKLVNLLLDFARIESNRMEASFESTDLSIYTQDLASSFRSAIMKAELKFLVDCPPLPEPVFIDRQMWEKIVMNLLSNALKFTFEGEISVTLRKVDNFAELTISDTGIGIAENEIPRMFDRFHRIANVKSRSHEGSGIGLAFVKELVSYHSGNITLRSTPGSGTSFKIQMPFGTQHLKINQIRSNSSFASNTILSNQFIDEAQSWYQEELHMDSNEIMKDGTKNTDVDHDLKSSPRILLADDNHDMRNYLKKLLSQYWKVDAVGNGQLALDIALQNPPDLILTDIMMPRLDGIQLLKSLRNHDKTKHIPIILLSARAGEEARIEGIATGADDYLVKPFSTKELIARVKTHLNLSLKRQETAQLMSQINDKLQNINTELEEKVKARTNDLEDEKFKLEKSNEELNQYATIVAHDLRAPVRSIRSLVDLLSLSLSPSLEKEVQQTITFIQSSAVKLESLIVNLLKVARVDSATLENTEINLNSILENIKLELTSEIKNTKATIQWTLLPSVLGNPVLLEALFSNLIGNALNYRDLKRSPEIFIDCKETVQYFEFSIKDNGIGIEEIYVNRIFEMFKRLHNDHERPGTGVGLAYCKKIVEGYGGKIWFKSTVGIGSTFYFTYPRVLHKGV